MARLPAGPRRLGMAAAFAVTVVAGALLIPAVAQAQTAVRAAPSDPYPTSSTSATTPEHADHLHLGTVVDVVDDDPTEPPSSSSTTTTPPPPPPPPPPPTSSTTTTTTTTTTPPTATAADDPRPAQTSTTTSTSTPPRAEIAVFDPGPCVGAFVTAHGSGFIPDEQIT